MDSQESDKVIVKEITPDISIKKVKLNTQWPRKLLRDPLSYKFISSTRMTAPEYAYQPESTKCLKQTASTSSRQSINILPKTLKQTPVKYSSDYLSIWEQSCKPE